MSSKPPLSPADRSRFRPKWWAWHQRLGIGFAIVFLSVVLTGLALNHTEGLGLDGKRIHTDWLYDWYGMAPAGEPVAFYADGWAVAWGGRLTWNERLLGDSETLHGARRYGQEDVLVLADDLWVITPTGELLERLTSASLPPGAPERLGKASGDRPVVIETSAGRFASDRTLSGWVALAPDSTVAWSESVPLADDARAAAQRVHRGAGLTVYRVVLDLHSGRFFGRWGAWVVDLAAVALAFLALSGAWYALKVKRQP